MENIVIVDIYKTVNKDGVSYYDASSPISDKIMGNGFTISEVKESTIDTIKKFIPLLDPNEIPEILKKDYTVKFVIHE